MKGYLLDTNVAVFGLHESERLSPPIRAAIVQGPAFISVISFWEIMIKSQKRALDVGDPRVWWKEALSALALQPLPYLASHVAALYELPAVHQDPFDRALIAQATVEELTLLSTDSEIRRYESRNFRTIC